MMGPRKGPGCCCGEPHPAGGAPLFDMPKQDHHVLNGCRQVLLDLNPPEPPPAGPLEAVPRRSGEGSLHEMLPGPDILSRRRGSGSIPHPVQFVLTKMTLDRATGLCRRALASELTGVADAASAQIIHGLSLHVMPSRFEFLSRRASVAVGLRVIPEGLRPGRSPRVVPLLSWLRLMSGIWARRPRS